MRRSSAFLLVLLLPGVAGAAELRAALAGGATYDSNVFRTSSNPTSDFGFRVEPELALHQQEGRLQYDLRYIASWETYLQKQVADAIDDISHNVNASLSYAAGPKTSVTLGERFSRFRDLNNPRTFFDEDSVPFLSSDRSQTILNTATVGLSHRFSSRVSGNLDGRYDLFDSSRVNNVNSQEFSVRGGLDYRIDGQNSVGGGVNAVLQLFDETVDRPASDSKIYRFDLRWRRGFGEHTNLTIQGGPALVVSSETPRVSVVQPQSFPFVNDPNGPPGRIRIPDPTTCVGVFADEVCDFVVPVDPPPDLNDPTLRYNAITNAPPVTITIADMGVNDTQFTIFGRVRLSHAWSDRLASSLGYRRSQGQTSGLGGTTIRDSISFDTNWDPNPLWSVNLRASWAQRKSIVKQTRNLFRVAPVPFSDGSAVGLTGAVASVVNRNDVDFRRWDVGGLVRRRIAERFSVTLNVIYSDQSGRRRSASNAPNDSRGVVAVLTLKYDFDPLRIPIPSV